MRTAKDILSSFPVENNLISVDDAIDAINIARTEAIEEAAENAEANYEYDDGMWESAVVDKTSITKLIKQLK